MHWHHTKAIKQQPKKSNKYKQKCKSNSFFVYSTINLLIKCDKKKIKKKTKMKLTKVIRSVNRLWAVGGKNRRILISNQIFTQILLFFP